MSDQNREKTFVAAFKKLQTDWPKLTVDERQAKLKDIVDAAASPSGVPEVGIRPLKSASDAGNFDFPTWRLNLGEDQLKKHP
jgi:hypothetical protein